jgi:uncharacterized membrane protein
VNLNPFLSTRNINLFNDHFDPILFLFAPITSFVRPDVLAIRLDMISLMVASMAPVWLGSRGLLDKRSALWAFFLILFSPMTLRAAYFPAHPGTWSLAPLAWLLAFLFANKQKASLLVLLILLTCKEEYPVIAAGLAVIIWIQGRTRLAVGFMIVSLLWGLGVFVLRPLYLGQSDYYTSAVLSGEGITSPDLWMMFQKASWVIIYLFVPVLMINGIRSLKEAIASYSSLFWIPVSLAALLFVIRLSGGYWDNHRLAPLSIAAAFMIVGCSPRQEMTSLQKYMTLAVLLYFSASSLEFGSRVWRSRPFKNHCPHVSSRIESIQRSVRYLENSGARNVLASGNLVPRLASLPGISQVGASAANDAKFLFIEKFSERNTWPLSKQEFSDIENQWRTRPDVLVVEDDQHVLLLKVLD